MCGRIYREMRLFANTKYSIRVLNQFMNTQLGFVRLKTVSDTSGDVTMRSVYSSPIFEINDEPVPDPVPPPSGFETPAKNRILPSLFSAHAEPIPLIQRLRSSDPWPNYCLHQTPDDNLSEWARSRRVNGTGLQVDTQRRSNCKSLSTSDVTVESIECSSEITSQNCVFCSGRLDVK